jgi:hypothetical protein
MTELKQLAGALLDQTLDDVGGNIAGQSYLTQSTVNWLSLDALAWIMSDLESASAGLTFAEVCYLLDLPRGPIRRYALRRRQELIFRFLGKPRPLLALPAPREVEAVA